MSVDEVEGKIYELLRMVIIILNRCQSVNLIKYQEKQHLMN